MPAGNAMTVLTKLRMTICILCFSPLVVAAGQENSPTVRIKVAGSGSTVLSAQSPGGKASVTIHTAIVDDACMKTCPLSRALADIGKKPISLAEELVISIGGKPVAVPSSVYDDLYHIEWASLSYEKGTFKLHVKGREYLVCIYFDSKNGIKRMTVYDDVAAQLVEDAHYYQAILK